VATSTGQTVLVSSPATTPPSQFWYHGLAVQLAIGPDPDVARSIFNSLRYQPGAADTAAAYACALNPAAGAMPNPERLANQIVLRHGEMTLDPPGAGDQATSTASAAWDQATRSNPLERYRLILVRYTAKFPARQNPDGTFTAVNQNELAWVVYSTPYSATQGCGIWGLDVFDAQTGQPQGGGSWSPGP